VMLDRRSPPFAQNAKDGAPSRSSLCGATIEKGKEKEETQGAGVMWGPWEVDDFWFADVTRRRKSGGEPPQSKFA